MASYEGRYRETVKGFGGDTTPSEDGGQSLADMIQSLDSDLSQFKGCVQSIGTQFDDPNNRAELKRLRGVIKEKLTNADKELKSYQRDKPQQKIILDRQAKTLRDHANKFNDLLEAEKKAAKQNPLGSGATSPSYAESTGDPSADTSSLVQTQAGMSKLEIREREAADLEELERDIIDLHGIQMDLAGMVTEQGEDIDRIEVQTEKAQGRVEHGLQQTENAVVLKKKNVKLKLIVGGIVAGVVITLLIILIIVLAVFVPRGN